MSIPCEVIEDLVSLYKDRAVQPKPRRRSTLISSLALNAENTTVFTTALNTDA